MAWHAETPWAARKRQQAREAAQQTKRAEMLCQLCQSFVIGDIDVGELMADAKKVIEGDADRVIRCE